MQGKDGKLGEAEIDLSEERSVGWPSTRGTDEGTEREQRYRLWDRVIFVHGRSRVSLGCEESQPAWRPGSSAQSLQARRVQKRESTKSSRRAWRRISTIFACFRQARVPWCERSFTAANRCRPTWCPVYKGYCTLQGIDLARRTA